MKKRIWLSLCLTLLLCAFLVSCGAPKDETVIYDNHGGSLSDSEISGIRRQVAEADIGDASIAVVFAAQFYSDETAEEELAAVGLSGGDLIGLVIWTYDGAPTSGRNEYELYSHGDMTRYISDADFQAIDNAIRADIKSGNYASAVSTFVRMSAEAYNAGKPATWTQVLKVVGIAVTVGALSGGIAAVIVVTSYRRKSRSPSYPLQEFTRLYMTTERDDFLYHNVVKTRVVSSSSSGGGKSGGGGGGGGGRSSGRH